MTKYAQVVIHSSPVDMDFTYLVPQELDEVVDKGEVVVVPFKTRDKLGFVVDASDVSYPDARPIKRVLNIRLPESLLNTTKTLSYFYLAPWSKFLRETIPSDLSNLISRISWKRNIPKLKRREIIDALPKSAKRQKELLELLYEKGALSYSYLRRKLGIKNLSSLIDTLIEKGYIQYSDRELKVSPCEYRKTPKKEEFSLNLELSEGFKVYALNDLSFSERILFYLKLYEKFREKGSVLLIFPNHNILERVEREFIEAGYEGEVFSYHSGLRREVIRKGWACIREGKKALFLTLSKGPFLPINNLSLIIVDEEHSLEYVTKTDPIYHLRKVALERARWENIPIIFEAPKPSLFVYKGLLTGGYKKILLPKSKKKKTKILPNVIILERENSTKYEISSWLSYRIGYMYREKKKQFIFVNKRGYASLVCKDCGYMFKCPHCDLPLIYFSKEKELKCPRCTYKEKVPDFCPSCGGFNLVPWGEGVEKAKELIEAIAPDAKIVTISSDDHPDAPLSSEDYDIIIGTSFAFGYFELSDINFIGVLSIDNMLTSGTYHAAEDTFLFLNFLRINMKKTGEIIVETKYPEHRVFIAFSKNDPLSFYRREILYRKELFYPPFSNMVKFVLGAKRSELAKEKLSVFKELLKKVLSENGDHFFDVTGPYFNYKERDYYFWELLFKVENYDLSAPIFKGAYTYFFKKENTKDYRVRVEIDPDIL